MWGRFRSSFPAGTAAVLILASLQPGCAQVDDRYPMIATQSIAPAYAPTGSKTEWSGESGASGHPLMTSDAIRTAAANFQQCLERLWPEASRRGISRATYDAQTRGLTPDLKIMDLMDAQPEFTKAFWEYLDLLVSEDRIARGREILAQNRAEFDAMERAYGVDRHVITAIWGIEFEILHHDRRPAGGALDRDARLYRPPPGLFPQRILRHPRIAQSRRRHAG